MKHIFIVGKGWLGSQLADYFQKKAYQVSASVTKRSFTKGKTNLYSYDLGDEPKKVIDWKMVDVVIYTIPPSAGDGYSSQSNAFFKEVIAVNPKAKIIYISSTSVYGDQNGVLNEESSILPETTNATKISEVEKFLRNKKNACILRLGGLVGPKRHPVYSLSSRSKKISKPKHRINLIHSEDVVIVISKIVGEEYSFDLANLCTPDHPFRIDFYSFFASKFELKLPEFEQNNERKGKIVTSKVLSELSYEYKYSSAFDYKI